MRITHSLVLTYTHDAGDGFYLGDANIFTDASGRNVAVTFVCSFASTFTAESDDIEIEAGGEHHGHTSAEGSWEGSFHLHYVAVSFYYFDFLNYHAGGVSETIGHESDFVGNYIAESKSVFKPFLNINFNVINFISKPFIKIKIFEKRSLP